MLSSNTTAKIVGVSLSLKSRHVISSWSMHCRTINSERQWTGQCTQHGRCSRWFLSGVGISMRGNNCKTRTCSQGKNECSHGQHGSATFIHVEKDDHVHLMEETFVIVTLLESVTDQELDKRVEPKMRDKDSSI